MLANFKILKTLMAKKLLEASDYFKYITFLAIMAQDFKLKPFWLLIKITEQLKRVKTSVEGVMWMIRALSISIFCFRWNFSPNGCPNPQFCRYKHACIHSSQQHKGKSRPGTVGSSTKKQWPFLPCLNGDTAHKLFLMTRLLLTSSAWGLSVLWWLFFSIEIILV